MNLAFIGSVGPDPQEAKKIAQEKRTKGKKYLHGRVGYFTESRIRNLSRYLKNFFKFFPLLILCELNCYKIPGSVSYRKKSVSIYGTLNPGQQN
jgi:hypothetical protein